MVKPRVRRVWRQQVLRRRLLRFSAATSAAAVGSAALVVSGLGSAASAGVTAHYSLPLALQESLYFYDAQKSGPARSLGDQAQNFCGSSEPAQSCVPLQFM